MNGLREARVCLLVYMCTTAGSARLAAGAYEPACVSLATGEGLTASRNATTVGATPDVPLPSQSGRSVLITKMAATLMVTA